MRVMRQTPFKGTPQVKEHQVSLEGDCRDYRDTSREMVETTRTLAFHSWSGESARWNDESLCDDRCSQQNWHDERLTGVEATFGMRGAGSGLVASTPP